MRLQIGPGMLLPQHAGGFHLLGRGGGREARRDRVRRAALPVPALDQHLRFVIPALRGIEQRDGRIAIHEALAGNRAHAACGGGCEERIDGMRVHGAERRDRGGSISQAFIEEQRGDGLRVGDVGELLLGDEGVLVQPVEQLLAMRTDDLRLWVVHVAIDEPGQDQRILSVLFYMCARRELRPHNRGRPEMRDQAAGHADDRIALVTHRSFDAVNERIAGERERRPANRRDGFSHVWRILSAPRAQVQRGVSTGRRARVRRRRDPRASSGARRNPRPWRLVCPGPGPSR